MTFYRTIKKYFGVICIWVASLVLTYNISSNNKQLQEFQQNIRDLESSQRDSLKANKQIDSLLPDTHPESEGGCDTTPRIIYDDHGKQIHPNTLLIKEGPRKGEVYKYNHTTPMIFIGGMPRSGTTLMRVMMDAHPEVRCGEETRLVPRILGMRANWYRSTKEKQRLDEAGVTKDVVDQAMQQFIMEIIVRHGTPNKYLCNKDPFTLKSQEYLKELFPNSKFILMIRDGRATSHSIIERKVTISGFDITSYRDVLTKWNRAIESMYNQCLAAPDDCLPVWYEQLVLHPEQNLRKITKFLGIPWSDNMINHEDFVNQMGVSSVEKSTSQIQKPVYLDALIAWWGHIPADVNTDMEKIAPMLGKLGYKYKFNEDKSKPDYPYGKPDQLVLDKIAKFEENKVDHEWAG